MSDRDILDAPRGEIIENNFFLGSCNLKGSPERLAEDISCVLMAQNSLQAASRKAYLAPVSWLVEADGVHFTFAGFAESNLRDRWWANPEKKRLSDYHGGVTTGAVQEFLEGLLGVSVEVRPLYEGVAHMDDMRILNAIQAAYWTKGRWGYIQSYPTVDDLVSAGHQESSPLGSQGSYASTSPFFDVTVHTNEPSDDFNRAAYAAACKNLYNASGVLLSPRLVFQLKDKRWEIRAAGRCHSVGGFRYHDVREGEAEHLSNKFGSLEPATEGVANPIAHYLDAKVESVRIFKTTAAHYDDVVASQQMADEIGMLGLPEPEDFTVKPRREVLADDRARAKGELSTLLEPELTGEQELDALVGLVEAKRQIREMVAYIVACKKSKRRLPRIHLCMEGNPGTGKTTAARIIGHMLYDAGVLPKRNVFVETEGARFSASSISEARRGVLYIDEAYMLRSDDLAILVKAMEDCYRNYDRDGFVCIMSGYPQLMKRMISVNPGMRDRIGFFLDFEDYDANELIEIFNLNVARDGLKLDTAAQELIEKRLTQVENMKDANFANARLVEKIFDRIRMRQATMHGSSAVIKKDVIVDVFEDELADLVGEQRRTEKAKVDNRTGDEQLDALIGLDDIKRQIREYLDYAAVQKQRRGEIPRMHMVLKGDPGTGKTTLARTVGRMAFDRGLISCRNRFVEGDRETLVGAFAGHTAMKTKDAVARARHGVLFIDEAYALMEGPSDLFGKEAIDTLVKAMEDCLNNFEKEGFICIMAGYPDLMDQMISTNPGLRDRFGLTVEIDDYTTEQLMQALDMLAEKKVYTFAKAARTLFEQHLEIIVQHKDADFANIRLVENIFERCIIRQSSMHGTNSCIKCDVVESVFADADMAKLLHSGSASIGFQVA